jgi:hypothetical protein
MSTPPVGSTAEEKMAAKLRAQQSQRAAPPSISVALGLLGTVVNDRVNAKLADLRKRFGL